MDEDELDDLIAECPGSDVRYRRNSRATNDAIRELKELRAKNLQYEDEDAREYVWYLDHMLWMLGE